MFEIGLMIAAALLLRWTLGSTRSHWTEEGPTHYPSEGVPGVFVKKDER